MDGSWEELGCEIAEVALLGIALLSPDRVYQTCLPPNHFTRITLDARGPPRQKAAQATLQACAVCYKGGIPRCWVTVFHFLLAHR